MGQRGYSRTHPAAEVRREIVKRGGHERPMKQAIKAVPE